MGAPPSYGQLALSSPLCSSCCLCFHAVKGEPRIILKGWHTSRLRVVGPLGDEFTHSCLACDLHLEHVPTLFETARRLGSKPCSCAAKLGADVGKRELSAP